MRAGLDGLTFGGKTAMGDGLALGLEAARTPVANELGVPQRLPAALVLLSDGANTAGEEDPITVAERARRLRIPVYTVALGTQQGYIEHTRKDGTHVPRAGAARHRDAPGDRARDARALLRGAPTPQRLTDIYRGLGTRLATRREKQEVTAAFAGGGLALLVFGMVAAMARGGRLP